jgi:hypothetical protein
VTYQEVRAAVSDFTASGWFCPPQMQTPSAGAAGPTLGLLLRLGPAPGYGPAATQLLSLSSLPLRRR